jgi:hypothetical protein
MTEATEVEVTQSDRKLLDDIWLLSIRAIGDREPIDDAVLELLARHRQSSVPVQGEPVASYTPLGGLIEARQIAQMAYKDIERSKAINGHIDGNPYDVALSALNSVLGELSVLVSSPATHAPTERERVARAIYQADGCRDSPEDYLDIATAAISAISAMTPE